jgi:hypothetical protein
MAKTAKKAAKKSAKKSSKKPAKRKILVISAYDRNEARRTLAQLFKKQAAAFKANRA